ncbi:MAG: ComF family protein [Candidatus Berkelbacteria bacterium]|nr:ComF family protein [Candidatus Berkelbacteria bacterium]
MLETIINLILNLVFPKKCVVCGKGNSWFCPECIDSIDYYEVPFLRMQNSFLDGLISVAYFRGPIKEAIHAFKYDGVKELAEPLSEIEIKSLKKINLSFIDQSILVPVPLHVSRESERGFNQAVLLAEKIANKLDLKILKDSLIKTKKTISQTELNQVLRKRNIRGTFSFVGDRSKVKNRVVILIDDVWTTGSTMNECAKVLKKTGASRVWGLVLAKG